MASQFIRVMNRKLQRYFKMKDFNRTNLSFSLCGLNCGLCTMRLDEHCPGCGGGAIAHISA